MALTDPDPYGPTPLEDADLTRAKIAAALYQVARVFDFDDVADAAVQAESDALSDAGISEDDMDDARREVACKPEHAFGVLRFEWEMALAEHRKFEERQRAIAERKARERGE